MNYAIRSLLQLGDTNWVDAARGRLRTVKNGVQRLELAGELARGGTFDGWDLITSAITEGDLGHREVALRLVDGFERMKDASGKPVNLIEKLDQLRIGASQPVRDAVLTKIIQLTTEARPPAKARRPRN